ncbi:hypothetical protein L3Q82_023040, partial [Scortum barcoo]
AINDSVPDTAAHPNTEVSITTPVRKSTASEHASNEGRRSALLHRRAQLLKQVAELDKVLESIPPDDNSDGQSQHMSIQSHLSAADLSTLSSDVQSETCDSPEDPMSAAESVVKKEAGSEDDSDADYLPDGDGDISDFLSDPYGGSSDESTHSSPPTPTDKRRSFPAKKKAKSGSSLSKDKIVSPLEKTCAADLKKKKSSETVVLPCSGSKAQRVYDRRNYCLFCFKPVSKMARHLERIHSDKAEVAAAFQYPKNSRERQKIWNRLTNEGNFAHNKDVLKTGKGQLAVRKRPRQTLKAQDFLHCLYCRGLFVKKALFRHMRLCPEKVKNENETEFGRKRIASQCVLEVVGDLGVTDGFRSILSQMTYDDVTKTIMDDKVVLQFGELMFNHYGSDVKKHNYVRQNLRQIARLVLEAQKITPLEKLEDFFLPSSFPHVVSAVNVLAGYNPENKTYSIPSLAIKLGYHLQKACSIVEANAVKCGDENLAESARNFLSLYQKKWNKLISSGALTTLRKTKLRREKKVPFAQDVKRLNFHLENVHVQAEEKLRESSSAENYAALSKVILARTILFNRRRAREVSSVQLTAFMSRKKSSLQVGMDVSVSDLERTMCAFFTRVDIRGKCGRLVPVLLKPSFVSALELLVGLRETCGVPSKNPYLFGRPHALSAYNGSECIQKYVRACGAKDPEALTSAKIRKHYAKMLQLINLDENEANQILGPNNPVQTLRQDSNMQVDDVEMDSNERVQAARGQQAASWDCREDYGAEFYDEPAHGSATHANMTRPPRSAKSCKKVMAKVHPFPFHPTGSQNNGKHKWEEEEVLAVERHLMPLIQGHKVPQKNDCIQCLEAEPEALKTRSWRGSINEFVPNATAQDRNNSPQSPNSESRYGLDPELLPSAVKVIAEDRAEWEGKVFVSEPFSRLPPLATTSCIIEDRGSASPFAIRSTSYCVPCEGQTALLSRLPLGALVTPLTRQDTGEVSPLPVVKEPECVMGCGWCGASMCSAMGWQDCGQRFYCPFCGKLSEVPWQHYQPTKGVEGVRVDKDKRPELSMGSYEILNSQKASFDFYNWEDGDGLSDIRVGLMTYDSRIHLYDLSPALSRPHMLVITETEDLQLPVREGLLVSLEDCIDSIDSVLQLIPQFSPECDGASGVPMEVPVKAGLAVLQALNCPGKLLIFHTATLTEMGHTNTSSGFFGSNKPKSIFQPSEQTISLAKECVTQGCGVHLFVLSQQDVGGAWPGHIPYLTGGALYTYSHLQGELDKDRFSSDLKRTVETDTGYKAELRVFVSKDLRVSGCYGLFIPGPSPSHVPMATLDWRTTLAVELAHSRALDETRGVAIQAVLSYSSQTGEKRTRVHTLILRCSRHLQDTFRQYQAQTLLTFYCKKIYCAVLERPLQELREELQTEATEALASYRKHCCSASVSAGQLVLPQYLRALPVYINSLRKSEVLLPGLRSSIHQRLQLRCQVLSMDTCSTSTHFYPLLLPLLLSADCPNPPNPEEALRCCAASLEPRGLYLVHAPLTLLLWVGTQVPTCTLFELFNTSCFSSLPSGETKLPVLENPLSVSVRSLINTLNSQAPCARKLWVVKQGDTCEEALQRHLVEDKSPNGGASYADFLYHLHINSVRLVQ